MCLYLLRQNFFLKGLKCTYVFIVIVENKFIFEQLHRITHISILSLDLDLYNL